MAIHPLGDKRTHGATGARTTMCAYAPVRPVKPARA